MSTPLNMKARRVLTSDGVSATIDMPGSIDKITVKDISNLNAPVNSQFLEAEWVTGMDNGTALVRSYTGAQPATEVAQVGANGISLVDTSQQTVGARVPASPATFSAITRAAIAQVSSGSTAGISTNSGIVRLFQTTGMRQLGGMEFSVGNVVANTNFQLRWLDSQASNGFDSAGTSGFYRVVNNPPQYSPRQFFITEITNATSAVVTLSVDHDIAVDEEIAFVVPEAYGMSEMNELRGTVTAVSAANNTITMDIDSAAFSAFSFPDDADFQATYAQVVRFGNTASGVLASTDNIGAFQVQLGSAAVGDNGDELEVIMESGMTI